MTNVKRNEINHSIFRVRNQHPINNLLFILVVIITMNRSHFIIIIEYCFVFRFSCTVTILIFIQICRKRRWNPKESSVYRLWFKWVSKKQNKKWFLFKFVLFCFLNHVLNDLDWTNDKFGVPNGHQWIQQTSL